MSIIMPGYIVTRDTNVRPHVGHHVVVTDQPLTIRCADCDAEMGVESEPDTSLPCGCPDEAEHASGLAIQRAIRREYRVPRGACPGCHVGDDGISVHDCYIHRA